MESHPKPSREPWVVAFFVFFAVVFTANAVFIWLAHSSWNGVVTDNHYEKGLAFNTVIREQQRQDRLGWRGELDVGREPITRNDGRVERTVSFSLYDRSGTAISPARVTGLLTHPIRSGLDRPFEMGETAPGHFSTELAFPNAGQWDVTIHAEAQDESFRLKQRVHVLP